MFIEFSLQLGILKLGLLVLAKYLSAFSHLYVLADAMLRVLFGKLREAPLQQVDLGVE